MREQVFRKIVFLYILNKKLFANKNVWLSAYTICFACSAAAAATSCFRAIAMHLFCYEMSKHTICTHTFGEATHMHFTRWPLCALLRASRIYPSATLVHRAFSNINTRYTSPPNHICIIYVIHKMHT